MEKKWKAAMIKTMLLTGTALLAGCGKAPEYQKSPEDSADSAQKLEAEAVEITEIQSIAFWECGASIPEISCTTLTREEGGTRVTFDFPDQSQFEQLEDTVLLEQVQEILTKYKVNDWNGFHGSNSVALDGSSFGLQVTFTNGTVLSASGENSFPVHYSNVSAELNELIAPTVKKWREDRYPKVIQDTRIQGFRFMVTPKSGSDKFDCLFEMRGDDPGSIYLSADVKKEDYFFYGKVPNPPFEDLQELVEQYQLAEWNGYYEFASGDEAEENFYLQVGYESGESIEAQGNVLPAQYKETEQALMEFLWNYIQTNQDTFIPWE